MTEPATAELSEAVADDTHYRQAFGALCDESVVSAQEAIYADNGTKLLDKGQRIDRELYARLVKHKLRRPIDQQIGVEGMVTTDGLVLLAQDIAETGTLSRLLAAALGSYAPMVEPLREVPLPPPIALKLTLMRDQYPGLLRQSLKTMMVALFLGNRARLPAPQLAALAAAGLLHDLGMLHMNPAWLAPHRTMSPAERRHLRAHPITSMILLRDQGPYAPESVAAVLEHHERLDGSGYPRGVRSADISPLGQILIVAELVAALAYKFGEAAPYRLSLVLRLNHRAFPATETGELLGLLQNAPLPASARYSTDDTRRHFIQLGAAFDQWTACQGLLEDNTPAGPAYAWLNARLAGLRRVLVEAGGHLEQPGYLLQQAGEEEAQLADAAILGREALWQLGAIYRECLQRWPDLAPPPGDEAPPEARGGAGAVARWCHWVHTALPDTVRAVSAQA